jgi:hypothetical protein
MPAPAKALAPATRNAREEVKSAIWLTGDAVDVGGFETGIGYRVECCVGMQWICGVSRTTPSREVVAPTRESR